MQHGHHSYHRSRVVLEITDARPTARPEIIEVVLASTGKPMRLRRDMVEFYHRRVIMPMWLAAKLNPNR